jgi:hypothetical protein
MAIILTTVNGEIFFAVDQKCRTFRQFHAPTIPSRIKLDARLMYEQLLTIRRTDEA